LIHGETAASILAMDCRLVVQILEAGTAMCRSAAPPTGRTTNADGTVTMSGGIEVLEGFLKGNVPNGQDLV